MIINSKNNLSEGFNTLYDKAKELIEYGPIIVEIKPYVPNRGKTQNDYYFRMCKEIADFLRVSGLKGYTKSKVHNINKFIFNVETTTDLSKDEFCDYITEVIEYWQDKTNNYWVPSDNPRSYLKKMGF